MKKSVNRRITLYFSVILILTISISAGWNLYCTRQAILMQEESSVRRCADLVAGMPDHYGTNVLLDHPDERLHSQMRTYARTFCRGFRQNYLILYKVDPKTHVPESFLEVAADAETDQLLIEGKDPGIDRDIPKKILNKALQSENDRVFRKEAGHTLPVALSSFDKIRKAVFEVAGNTPETRKALLACDETLANIVLYSGAQTLIFSCKMSDKELSITFTDDGIPFDPVASQAGETDFDLLDNGGMGLSIIRQSASSVRYKRKKDRNKLTMHFQL